MFNFSFIKVLLESWIVLYYPVQFIHAYNVKSVSLPFIALNNYFNLIQPIKIVLLI